MNKIRRNDKCICGSLKKYKVCCGRGQIIQKCEECQFFYKGNCDTCYDINSCTISYLQDNKFDYKSYISNKYKKDKESNKKIIEMIEDRILIFRNIIGEHKENYQDIFDNERVTEI